jgi:integrase
MKKSPLLRLPAGPRQPVKRPKQGRALAIRPRGGTRDVPKLRRHPNRSLTEAEIRNLLFAIVFNRDNALIRLGLSVGLRVSEVVTIRTSEIDFDRGLIKIWDEEKD